MFDVKTSIKCYAELLAPELLAMIFHEVMALHERDPVVLLPTSEESCAQENEVDTEPLIALSHCSRYWRGVALGTPALWRRIHGRSHDQMEVFLVRSRLLTASLFLDVEHFGATPKQPLPASMVSVVRTHAARLCRLDLSMVPARVNIALSLMSLHASHLECLTITSPCMDHSFNTHTMSRDPLLNNETSSLKALALMPIVNWIPSCTSFPNLTHLFISFDREQALGHPFHVLQLLSNTPALVFLHIDFLLYDSSFSGDWRPSSQPVPLLHLRSLVFTSCDYKHMYRVLSRLSFPEDIFIRLQDLYTDVHLDEYPPSPSLALRPITNLDLSLGDYQILMVADGPTSGFWFEGHQDGGDPPAPGWETWFLRLHDAGLTLSHVTYLHITIDVADSTTSWPEILARLPKVSDLAVLLSGAPNSDSDTPNPVAVLCRALEPNPGAAAHVRCPALRTLNIEWEDKVTPGTIAAFALLPQMLAARAQAGHPVHRVVVQAVQDAPLSLYPGPGFTVLAIFRDSEHLFNARRTQYEVVGREDGAKGLCAFEMRDVWRVDGEERYWEVDVNEKPRYALPRRW